MLAILESFAKYRRVQFYTFRLEKEEIADELSETDKFFERFSNGEEENCSTRARLPGPDLPLQVGQ